MDLESSVEAASGSEQTERQILNREIQLIYSALQQENENCSSDPEADTVSHDVNDVGSDAEAENRDGHVVPLPKSPSEQKENERGVCTFHDHHVHLSLRLTKKLLVYFNYLLFCKI